MPRGGPRPGAGRRTGLPGASKKTKLAIRRWARSLMPEEDLPEPAISVMRQNMHYWHVQARTEAMQLTEFLAAKEATPEQVLKIVSRYHNARDKSQDCARDLISYESPRLSQVTLKVTDIATAPDPDLNGALLSMGLDLDKLLEEVRADIEDAEYSVVDEAAD